MQDKKNEDAQRAGIPQEGEIIQNFRDIRNNRQKKQRTMTRVSLVNARDLKYIYREWQTEPE